jgi:hypothetical protein
MVRKELTKLEQLHARFHLIVVYKFTTSQNKTTEFPLVHVWLCFNQMNSSLLIYFQVEPLKNQEKLIPYIFYLVQLTVKMSFVLKQLTMLD